MLVRCSSSGGTTCGTCSVCVGTDSQDGVSYGVASIRRSGAAEVGECYVRLSGTGLIEIGMLIVNAVVNGTN